MSAKMKGANGNRGGSVASAQADPVASSQEIAVELASVAAALAEDDDVFSDIPTVSNRANPAASPSEIDKDSGQGLAGAGSYRMVRPATSDRVAIPDPPSAPKRPSGNRVIIGVARKSH